MKIIVDVVKKIITLTGEVEIHPTRYSCVVDRGQSIYPLLDFIDPIVHEINSSLRGIKCTRNAASSITMVCAESPYAQATDILKQLMGLDTNTMTSFNILDSVGSEFVKEPTRLDDKMQIAIND